VTKKTTKEQRLEEVAKLRFDAFDSAVRRHFEELQDGWADSDPRPLSRAYELLQPAEIHGAIVQWCLAFAREHYPGTLANPVAEQHLPQLFCGGKIDLPELPYLRPWLNRSVLLSLMRGDIIACGLEANAVASGKRRQIAADRWTILTPDFAQDSAALDGQTTLYGIEVERARESAVDRRRPRRAEVQKWLDKWHADYLEANGRYPGREKAYTAAQNEFPGFVDYKWLCARLGAKKPADQRGRGRPKNKWLEKIGR
jgi:hypothetical protein